MNYIPLDNFEASGNRPFWWWHKAQVGGQYYLRNKNGIDGIGPIHGRRGGINQMLPMALTAPFQNIRKADHIAVNVCHWIFQGVADAHLRGKIYHLIKFFAEK